MQKLKEIIRGYCLELSIEFGFILKIVNMFRPFWKKYIIKSFYDYCQNTNSIVVMLDINTTRKCKKPPENKEVYESWPYKQSIVRDASRQYISLIKDAIVIGDTDGIIAECYYLTDKIEFDIKGFLDHKPLCMEGNEKKCIIKYKSDIVMELPRAITLIKMWSCNYFHFVFEAMSRLGEIEKLDKYKDWPLLIDDVVKEDSRNLELIDMLNVNKRQIIWVKRTDYILVKELLVPPCMTWALWDIPEGVKKGFGYMIDHKAGEYLRNTILRNYHPKRKYSCVYVARGNNKRLVNEDEIITHLKRNGFDIFYPDKVTFKDEVDCFATADCIILCAGGANTNLVFCKKNAQLFSILPFEFRCDSPEGITSTVGLNIHLRDAEIVKKGDILMHSTIRFPIEKCNEIIKELKIAGIGHFNN